MNFLDKVLNALDTVVDGAEELAQASFLADNNDLF